MCYTSGLANRKAILTWAVKAGMSFGKLDILTVFSQLVVPSKIEIHKVGIMWVDIEVKRKAVLVKLIIPGCPSKEEHAHTTPHLADMPL